MNTNVNTTSIEPKGMAWYKVPIMWLMVSLLGFTVFSGVYLFFLAHYTNDSIVTDQKYAPLSKKLAFPDKPKVNQN